MNVVRFLLFPFAILYGWITDFRNFLYDKDILKSYQFDLPVIAVGNLNVGGTGKTPQIEYLIRLLSHKYKVATLSRGYKRQSKGFILADETSNAKTIGDEPFQFFKKFPEIYVAVDANRKNGIEELLSLSNKPEVILLDDAFQHRKVKAGFYILLTAYDDLYCDDFMLPTGLLRESRNGSKRADIIIVTKCPKNLSEIAQIDIKKKLKFGKEVFFSFIDYDEKIYSSHQILDLKAITNQQKLLIAGIAKPEPFFNYLKDDNTMILQFSDHHFFDEKDVQTIEAKAKNRIIITTEKDYVRLQDKLNNEHLYHLPITSSFIADQNNFDKIILNYVGKSSTNRKLH